MCNVDRVFLLNTATSAKAAQHKLTGKLNSNVNFVYLDCPQDSVLSLLYVLCFLSILSVPMTMAT